MEPISEEAIKFLARIYGPHSASAMALANAEQRRAVGEEVAFFRECGNIIVIGVQSAIQGEGMSNVMTPEHEFTDDERRLYELMSDISEDCYCAGWMHGNEFALWNAIATGDLRYGMGEMDRDKLAQVTALSVKTGKWIIWRDDNDGLDPHDSSEWGPYAITLEAWVSRRAAPAAGTEKDAERLDWVLANRHLRVQGNDENGWCVLDCSDGLTFMVKDAATAREAIDAAIDARSPSCGP